MTNVESMPPVKLICCSGTQVDPDKYATWNTPCPVTLAVKDKEPPVTPVMGNTYCLEMVVPEVDKV